MIELDWDPEVDAPATIAIIGGGPVGIEAAIYARFLGYFVSIFEERRVAHRMLDWHNRPLSVSALACTTSLGHAAIRAQNPEYVPAASEHVFTGKTFAEEYLLPLAKTDLLFDDIHFLSPVIDVSRLRTFHSDAIDKQERCNDEFRLVVAGRHRGVWTARADIVIDCRGLHQQPIGWGPGGGMAIGEREFHDSHLMHAPLDRKFEARFARGKRICLIGESYRAALFASEFLDMFGEDDTTRLIWVVRDDARFRLPFVASMLSRLADHGKANAVVQEALGVEQVQKNGDLIELTLLKNDDSTVQIQCDAIAPFLDGIPKRIASTLDESPVIDEEFCTREPGYYVLRAGTISDGAGSGLSKTYRSIRSLFAMIAGREDLDLYKIMEQQGARSE